jgi:hypothetical protein
MDNPEKLATYGTQEKEKHNTDYQIAVNIFALLIYSNTTFTYFILGHSNV